MDEKAYTCCILGAGPAGLGTAWELVKNGITDILLIDRNSTVGGLSRTEARGGARFDLGPHRFFSKNPEINRLWHDVLGEDFRPVDRLTRIFYQKRFFHYPLKPFEALRKMGPAEGLRAIVSFIAGRRIDVNGPENFETWVIRNFGRKLYEIFFKTYTEKVWGIPCSQISPEWAAQRIKDLDFLQIIKKAILGNSGRQIKTLVEQFDYPVLGAGQMYEAMERRVTDEGAEVLMNHTVMRIHLRGDRIRSIEIVDRAGERKRVTAQQFFSSIPITHFFRMCDPAENEEIRRAAGELYFRDHITVDLLIQGENLFPDQWIYIHSPEVKMARLANYNNFSRKMAGRENVSAISVEYFAFQHEKLWRESDEDLIALAKDELDYMGLVKKDRVEQGWVQRETESYPTYYLGFQEPYEIVKSRLNQLGNLYPIGRGGMYKYNNQDHSILSGMLAARNFLKLPGSPYNLWNINIDAEYQEKGVKGRGDGNGN